MLLDGLQPWTRTAAARVREVHARALTDSMDTAHAVVELRERDVVLGAARRKRE
jgi:hypothetical protein